MFNILYRPRLPDGKPAPLTWCLKLYRWFNTICWPLEDGSSYWIYLIDRLLWFLGFILFIMHNDADVRYLRENFHNLDEMLSGVPTYLALVEIHLRAFSLGWRKNDLRKLLKKFYAEIYIEESANPKLIKKIKRKMRPIIISSILYLCALNSYTLKAIYVLATNKRELLYYMIPIVDYKNNYSLFFLFLMSNIWVGFIIGSMFFGEANILGHLVFHLNGRYLMMSETLNEKVDALLKLNLNNNIIENYEQALKETLKENLRLNKFAQEIQDEFSFRIFIMFAFSAMSLCALGFKVYTSPANSIAYLFWAMGKILDIIAYGQIGTTIISTTDELSAMYYKSQWEKVIERSTKARDNVHLMKFVTLCMVTNRKAFHFTGLNFFNVSLLSALTVLKAASSYITFLVSLR